MKNNKYYILDMFPYPSGEGLHVGHPKGYISTDILSRYKKMNGFEVIHPMGWDAFGLPAEQYALKNKIHPAISTQNNINNFKNQLNKINLDYDWDREISTTDPKFYKWTQWIFKQMYNKGLAWQSNEPINWCPSCKTGLANEDLEGNTCERCGTIVEKKPLRQWVLDIIKYADRLIDDLDELRWPEWVKVAQRNWIGRSEGSEIDFEVKGLGDEAINLTIFTTRADTIFGATFMAINYNIAKQWIENGWQASDEIKSFISKLENEDKNRGIDFDITKLEKEGINTGLFAVNPANNKEISIYIANYILSDYGTGAIMAVPAHDERDYEFAKKYAIEITKVIQDKNIILDDENTKNNKMGIVIDENILIENINTNDGILINSEQFDNITSEEARVKITDYVDGRIVKKYKLKDWVFARQRYWGEPFPIVFATDDEGVVDYNKPFVVADSELPIILPDVESYEPTGTGESPLANIKSFTDIYGYINDENEFVSCDKNDNKAKLFRRETNTMPQWAGSSWYWLRFLDPHNDNFLIDSKIEKEWPQVDVYVGGDHATRHLIYARFWHKFLFDIGIVSNKEPFTRLEFLGFILAEDGRKMSKRFGNVINPDDIVDKYGSDVLRLYEMFMAPFEATALWNTSNIAGVQRFLQRLEKLKDRIGEPCSNNNIIHQTIKKVGEDIEAFRFNTAISQMMILLNEFESKGVSIDEYKIFIQLLWPFAPEICERLSKEMNIENMWPTFDENKLIEDNVNIAFQVNGKLRDTISVPINSEQDYIMNIMTDRDSYKKYIIAEPKKIIFVKNKIVNVVG